MSEFTALGAHIYAGGFTVGVSPYFKVLAHFEDAPYGAETVQHNFPNLPIYTGGLMKWPLNEYKNKVDFGYANPPCAVWSVIGRSSRQKGGKKTWDQDPRVDCWQQVFAAFMALEAPIFAIESVTQAFTKGRSMIDDLASKAHAAGYNVTHLLVNAQYVGGAQRRKRYFFIAHKYEIPWETIQYQKYIDNPQLPGPYLEQVRHDPGFMSMKMNQKHLDLLPKLKQGQGLRHLWEQENPPETWVHNRFGVSGRPRLTLHRIDPNRVLGTIVGCHFIHPTEDRALGNNELKVLMGFPTEYKFVHSNESAVPSLIARGVSPQVALWLARQVNRALTLKIPVIAKNYTLIRRCLEPKDAPNEFAVVNT